MRFSTENETMIEQEIIENTGSGRDGLTDHVGRRRRGHVLTFNIDGVPFGSARALRQKALNQGFMIQNGQFRNLVKMA